MKTARWWQWLGIGWLVAACSLMTVGCGDDEDEEAGGGGTVVTNIVQQPGGGTTVVVVTNWPAETDDDDDPDPLPPLVVPDDDDDDDPLPLLLAAPALVSPADGTSFSTFNPMIAYNVTMEWGSVSGADMYIIEVDGTQYATDGNSRTMGFGVGTHTWQVWARSAADINGHASGTRSFTIRQRLPIR